MSEETTGKAPSILQDVFLPCAGGACAALKTAFPGGSHKKSQKRKCKKFTGCLLTFPSWAPYTGSRKMTVSRGGGGCSRDPAEDRSVTHIDPTGPMLTHRAPTGVRVASRAESRRDHSGWVGSCLIRFPHHFGWMSLTVVTRFPALALGGHVTVQRLVHREHLPSPPLPFTPAICFSSPGCRLPLASCVWFLWSAEAAAK